MQLEIGSIVTGKVSGITKFGAFVDLEGGKTGMVHISELENKFVANVSDVLTMGDEIKVKVIGITPEGKISLSLKQAQPPVKREDTGPQRPARPPARKPPRREGWAGNASSQQQGPMDFEQMLAKFKQQSEDKFSDLKKNVGSGSNRRGGQRVGKP